MTAKKKPPPLRVTVDRRPIYTIDVDQMEMLDLADGICRESVARRAHRCLDWLRAGHRQAARTAVLRKKASHGR